MTKFLGKMMTVLVVLMIALASAGCRETRKTEVKDKLFGGTEVKETTVREVGDKATKTVEKTEYDANGNKVKVETKTTGDTGTR